MVDDGIQRNGGSTHTKKTFETGKKFSVYFDSHGIGTVGRGKNR
jgi:hypothetical protein